jgi:chromosome segregation ATPase
LTEREAWERVSRMEDESTATLASAREEIESLVQKVALLECELAEVHRDCESTKETTCGLSDEAADVERRWEESERGHRE